jgi:hypothetical protein
LVLFRLEIEDGYHLHKTYINIIPDVKNTC